VTLLEIADRPSPNHARRGEPARIDMLVLHYTGMANATAALDRLCDPAARVSAHYLVEENGTIWRLVSDERRAFHAGRSCWAGENDLNHVSIGIEIVNPGHEWGYRPFPEEQMTAVERLCHELISRYSIPPHRIVGHSDVAPDRKSDPGELFDWPGLAHAGIGLWPQPAPDLARSRGRGVGVGQPVQHGDLRETDPVHGSAPRDARRPAEPRTMTTGDIQSNSHRFHRI